MAGAAASPPGAEASGGLTGGRLVLAGFVLALSNFIVVLDTTIANVSVPHISGGLGVSASEGTWVVTSYSVAEAICVPLTGWLVKRFGAVRTFMGSLLGFGLCSALCGLSTSLGMLLFFRLGQGFCGGPLMPLTQTLLLRIFPRDKQPGAMALWAMTTVTAPIAGPIIGGTISDNWSWEWIFYINVPIVAVCFAGVVALLRGAETPVTKARIDWTGLGLLVVWVGALQVMLDSGRDDDWFSSPFIVACAIVAGIGFALFLVWELTEREPVVDLAVFRHRGFSASLLTMVATFGTFFATVVIIPQWLQQSMGYTATQAGQAMAMNGILAVLLSPLVPKLMQKVDPRLIVFCGVAWIGAASLVRTTWSTDSTWLAIALPQLMQGAGLAMFFVPITVIGLGAVKPEETASAAGLMNFARTLAGAIGVSIATTYWADKGEANHNVLADSLNAPEQATAALQAQGLSPDSALASLNALVDQQSLVTATNHLFAVAALIFVLSASLIWLAPRPLRAGPPPGAH